MFTFEEYFIGWLVYFAFIIGVLAVFWWLTKAIPWINVKNALRVMVSAVFLVPVRVPETDALWAPAWIVGALELIFSGVEAFIPIGQTLLIAAVLALLIYCVLYSLWWYLRSKRSA